MEGVVPTCNIAGHSPVVAEWPSHLLQLQTAPKVCAQ
jgi:hypothetical protein